MNILNLDRGFAPYSNIHSNEIHYEKFKFPGGESFIKIKKTYVSIFDKEVIITQRYKNDSSLFEIALAKNALENLGYEKFQLFLPYFPHARQDRIANKGEALSVKVAANFINSLGFDKVIIVDPHSDVTPALINNVVVHKSSLFNIFVDIKQKYGKRPYLISPDAGATKKVSSLFNEKVHFDLIQCLKNRNTKTGELSGFTVTKTPWLGGHPCIIVDDICDGGGTFIGLAKALKDKGAGDLYLYVTHGIFSKGLGELTKYFKHIYTTNSVPFIDGANAHHMYETYKNQITIKLIKI